MQWCSNVTKNSSTNISRNLQLRSFQEPGTLKKNSLTLLYSNLDMLKHLHFRALFTPSWVHHYAVAILTIVGVPLRCYVVFHNPGNARCGLCRARQRWLEGGLQTIFRVASFSGTGLCETVFCLSHIYVYTTEDKVYLSLTLRAMEKYGYEKCAKKCCKNKIRRQLCVEHAVARYAHIYVKIVICSRGWRGAERGVDTSRATSKMLAPVV